MSPDFSGSRVASGLEPGKSITAECVVSDLYDMNRPGQYSIQLERIWRQRAVPSNMIKVRIVE